MSTQPSKRTKGPWEYRVMPGATKGTKALFVYQVGPPGPYHAIARVMTRDFTWAEAEANARLISAAPDLLRTLEVVEMLLEDDEPISINLVRAAIAKATG